jgi:hypothetical protein
MADELYLNLWFPSFEEDQILPRLQSVLRQFPFSATQPGVGYVAVHPIDWNEPTLMEESFDFRADPTQAMDLFRDYIHADYAYELEATWDLWSPVQEGDLDETWQLQPQPVRFIAHGTEFGEQIHREQGHVQVDFGLDTPFLHEEAEFTPQIESRIKGNVQKLVNFTHAVEKNCGISGRVLWSESEDNLAQKLIAKLQRVQ